MRVSLPGGDGIKAASETAAPSTYGIDSIAVDPANLATVYMVFPELHSCDTGCAKKYVQIYRSIDGGRNFTAGGLEAAHIEGDPNGEHRQSGERLMVDPADSNVLYYGSDKQGLWRSRDQGATWTQYNTASGIPPNIEVIQILFAPKNAKDAGANAGSRAVYAISIQNGHDTGGDVYRSLDGGASWVDVSTGVKDGGAVLAQRATFSTLDPSGTLYVAENWVTNGDHRAYWRWRDGVWKRFTLEKGGSNQILQSLTSVIADPNTPARLYAMGRDTSLARSDDDGVIWTSLGAAVYGNRFGWLPQMVGMSGGSWHSNGGLHITASGTLWVPTGHEGILAMSAATAAGKTPGGPGWIIASRGIEEQVSQEVIIPRGSSDTIIAATEDTTGFVIKNPDAFTATQIPLQKEIIAHGVSVDTAPDVPSYIAISSSNVYSNGSNYSGYSTDGGATWNAFGPALKFACTPHSTCDVQAGQIAVSVRGTRKFGSDHIVTLPPLNLAPEYSHDGGKTWHVTKSFPLAPGGMQLNVANGAYRGFFVAELHQRLLRADPFVADKFYLKFTHAPAPLYISSDGGVTWAPEPAAALPDGAFHGQLATNSFVKDDLWYADGWEGSAEHGVYHSTDGGKTFAKLQAFTHAINIAVGKGSARDGDAAYAVYVYGQIADGAYGVFQSSDAGKSWNRIAYYPLGIYDRPVTLAASQDTFGKVVLGWAGNSFAYAQYVPHAAPVAAAGAK